MIRKLNDIFNLIKQNAIANRFVKVFSVDVLVKGSVFLLLPVYLHLMTQEEVGEFNYIYVFIQTFSIVLNFGLNSSQSKLYHVYEGAERKQLLFSINMILASFLVVVLIPVYFLKLDVWLINFLFGYSFSSSTYRWVLLLALLTSVGSFMLFNYLLTSENIRKVQVYNLSRMIITNGVVLAIVCFSKEDKVFVRLIIYYTCEVLLLIVFARVYVKNFLPKFNIYQIKRILSISLPGFLLSVVSAILAFSDKFFVQQKTSMSVMAVYTTGITIASVCSLVIMSFQNIWLPIFLKENDVQANLLKTKKMAKIIVVIFSGIALLMIVGVKIALHFTIIPISYNDVIWLLPFLFLAQIISAVNTLYGNYFLYFERTKLGAFTGGCVYVVFFALNFILIPRYGVNGALISLLLGNTLLLVIVYNVVKRLCRKNISSKHEPTDYTVVVPE